LCPRCASKLQNVAFAGADVVTLFQRQHKNAAVSNLPSARGFNDRLDDGASIVGCFDHTARWCVTSKVPLHDANGKIVGAGDFSAQTRQVFRNLLTALESAGAGYRNVAQFTTYLVNSRDIAKLRAFRERYYPKFFPDGQYPPNTLLVVDRLASEEMLLEIAAIAVLD